MLQIWKKKQTKMHQFSHASIAHLSLPSDCIKILILCWYHMYYWLTFAKVS